MTRSDDGAYHNHLLALLPDREREALQPHVERVTLELRELVYDVSTPIRYAYFPEDGVVSLIGVMRDGAAVEVATVGNEGMLGLPLFLGVTQVTGQAFSQIPGTALRIEADRFRALAAGGKLRELMQRYTVALFTQISQVSACNRLHLAEERFARWLLMTHDRMGKDDFMLTQEFLSQMLGVRRATVSEIAAKAQDDGIIRYARGQLTVLDRARLEARSCECYAVIRAEFERLLGKPRNVPDLPAMPSLPSYSKDGRSTAEDGSPREERVQDAKAPRD
jgi:CRP-like cAMP-binding protein